MYHYIFFDLDGTLTDSKEGILNSLRYAFDKHGQEKEQRGGLLSRKTIALLHTHNSPEMAIAAARRMGSARPQEIMLLPPPTRR